MRNQNKKLKNEMKNEIFYKNNDCDHKEKFNKPFLLFYSMKIKSYSR